MKRVYLSVRLPGTWTLRGVDGKSDDAEKNVSVPATRHICFCPVIPLGAASPPPVSQSRLRVTVDVSYELHQKPVYCFISSFNFSINHPDHSNELKCSRDMNSWEMRKSSST